MIKHYIGIDFGARNIRVGVCHDARYAEIAHVDNGRCMSNAIHFGDKGRAFGEAAVSEKPFDPSNAITCLKLLSLKFRSAREFQEAVRKFDSSLTSRGTNELLITVRNEELSISTAEMLGMIFTYLVNDIRNNYQQLAGYTISLPEAIDRRHFNLAAELANMKNFRIVDDGLAAATAYSRRCANANGVLIIGIGARFATFTLFDVTNGDPHVVLTSCHQGFAGDDFDVELAAQLFRSSGKEGTAPQRLVKSCEKLKIDLSSGERARVDIEVYPKEVTQMVTRDEFEDLCSPVFEKFQKALDGFLGDVKRQQRDVTDSVLIGGTTIIPKIRELVGNAIGQEKLSRVLDIKEGAAQGAALYAERMAHSGAQLENRPLSEISGADAQKSLDTLKKFAAMDNEKLERDELLNSLETLMIELKKRKRSALQDHRKTIQGLEKDEEAWNELPLTELRIVVGNLEEFLAEMDENPPKKPRTLSPAPPEKAIHQPIVETAGQGYESNYHKQPAATTDGQIAKVNVSDIVYQLESQRQEERHRDGYRSNQGVSPTATNQVVAPVVVRGTVTPRDHPLNSTHPPHSLQPHVGGQSLQPRCEDVDEFSGYDVDNRPKVPDSQPRHQYNDENNRSGFNTYDHQYSSPSPNQSTPHEQNSEKNGRHVASVSIGSHRQPMDSPGIPLQKETRPHTLNNANPYQEPRPHPQQVDTYVTPHTNWIPNSEVHDPQTPRTPHGPQMFPESTTAPGATSMSPPARKDSYSRATDVGLLAGEDARPFIPSPVVTRQEQAHFVDDVPSRHDGHGAETRSHPSHGPTPTPFYANYGTNQPKQARRDEPVRQNQKNGVVRNVVIIEFDENRVTILQCDENLHQSCAEEKEDQYFQKIKERWQPLHDGQQLVKKLYECGFSKDDKSAFDALLQKAYTEVRNMMGIVPWSVVIVVPSFLDYYARQALIAAAREAEFVSAVTVEREHAIALGVDIAYSSNFCTYHINLTLEVRGEAVTIAVYKHLKEAKELISVWRTSFGWNKYRDAFLDKVESSVDGLDRERSLEMLQQSPSFPINLPLLRKGFTQVTDKHYSEKCIRPFVEALFNDLSGRLKDLPGRLNVPLIKVFQDITVVGVPDSLYRLFEEHLQKRFTNTKIHFEDSTRVLVGAVRFASNYLANRPLQNVVPFRIIFKQDGSKEEKVVFEQYSSRTTFPPTALHFNGPNMKLEIFANALPIGRVEIRRNNCRKDSVTAHFRFTESNALEMYLDDMLPVVFTLDKREHTFKRLDRFA